MPTIVLRRLLIALPTMLAMTFIVFFLVKLIPGDAARLALGDKATEEALSEYREQLGLNEPVSVQYLLFMKRMVLEGDLGVSIRSNERITAVISEKFPATLELALAAMLFALAFGVPLGLFAAIRPGSWLDLAAMGGSVLGVSMPVFWLGLILMWFLGLELGWFPLSGRVGIEFFYEPVTGLLFLDGVLTRQWDLALSGLHHLVLPAVTLGTIPLAFLARMTRATILDVMRQDFIRTAHAKGLRRIKVYLRHGLRNAAIPVVNISALQFGTLLAGAMITETIYSWPGMGRWILESVSGRDIPAIEGGVLVIALSFILINLISDILFRLLDARVKIS